MLINKCSIILPLCWQITWYTWFSTLWPVLQRSWFKSVTYLKWKRSAMFSKSQCVCIYIYIYIYREREREFVNGLFFSFGSWGMNAGGTKGQRQICPINNKDAITNSVHCSFLSASVASETERKENKTKRDPNIISWVVDLYISLPSWEIFPPTQQSRLTMLLRSI